MSTVILLSMIPLLASYGTGIGLGLSAVVAAAMVLGTGYGSELSFGLLAVLVSGRIGDSIVAQTFTANRTYSELFSFPLVTLITTYLFFADLNTFLHSSFSLAQLVTLWSKPVIALLVVLFPVYCFEIGGAVLFANQDRSAILVTDSQRTTFRQFLITSMLVLAALYFI